MTPDELSKLYNACFPEDPRSADVLEAEIAASAAQFHAVPNGFVIAHVTPPEADIITLGVHPNARRQGKARALIEALAVQVERIFLEVAADNVGAIAFYTAIGFEHVGHRPNYYKRSAGPDVDALVMRWKCAT